MNELPFLVPPQMLVGKASSTVEVVVSASPTVFPDHEQFVTLTIRRLTKPHQMLAEAPRVPRSERAIDEALREMAVKVGGILDREDLRMRKLLPGGLRS